ncbi:hypothetical protein jhhlp_003553 [Lomentospora prolificans]|uniref:Uncharacterized protein n=1 Tax=Lomentospora prolificans TaxID=41688 RepID=A0A2N3N926_9PEZI|nr:hypothetical protein jhhlp_003553 [Lomentospora prolificans]
MDAKDEEGDIKLQKESAELIAEFERSLPTFLRKPDGHGGTRLRTRVRTWETFKLNHKLLAPFQELPQLLDPHLSKFIPVLSEAYLQSLAARARTSAVLAGSKLLEPVPRAVARLLYSFCKIRGEKVIVRFLSSETKCLEQLLSALEEAEKLPVDLQNPNDPLKWTWQERYFTLLWLSHLLFAPFDLASISSVDLNEVTVPAIPGLNWPPNLPGITLRLLPLAFKYLSSPGKERDAAKELLVRVSMRTDMQRLGLLDALVNWSLWVLRPSNDPLTESPYHFIGVLSYLAGILRSSMDTSDMDKYLLRIFHAISSITSDGTGFPNYEAVNGSAFARKIVIKVMRSIAVLVLRRQPQTVQGTELVETCIGTLLEKLSDNDTPVRFAASKALSIITLRLDPDMASQVVEAVLDSLNRRVVWTKDPTNPDGKLIRDLSSVDPLEWHGLMLTLSHLLYRRSPPPNQLSDIIHALLLGLSFEQRSTSGGSIGSNVRDAACFGIWALARRYTTQELLEIPVDSVFAAKSHPPDSTILQVLATELTVAASRDPAGNIRRGSSAALQELVGRHPDTVEQGIWLVQTVDYHAVALRSRALHDVAIQATNLSTRYGEALLDSLLGWRGVGDADAGARRAAGTSFGAITFQLASLNQEGALRRLTDSVNTIIRHIQKLKPRQAEERHGLLLSLASVFDKVPETVTLLSKNNILDLDEFRGLLCRMVNSMINILEALRSSTLRRQELAAEAASRLVVSSLAIFQAAILTRAEWNNTWEAHLRTGQSLIGKEINRELLAVMAAFDTEQLADRESEGLVTALGEVLPSWLEIVDEESEELVDAIPRAALTYLVLSRPTDRATQVRNWAELVKVHSSKLHDATGYFHAVAMAYPICYATGMEGIDAANLICDSLLQRWVTEKNLEVKSSLLSSLARSNILRKEPRRFLGLLMEGLNDYTATSRGDIGAYLRGGSLKATRTMWQSIRNAPPSDHEWLQRTVSALFLSVLRLAAEKLDRVRNEAHKTLALLIHPDFVGSFQTFTPSSTEYFDFLLRIFETDCLLPLISQLVKADRSAWMCELLAGYVTSADTGNESLVIVSRELLCEFCEESQEKLDSVCSALMQNLRDRQGQDRLLIPTLEIISFLLNVGLMQKSGQVDARTLTLLTQKSSYKSSNVRKLETCIKVYGGIARIAEEDKRHVKMKRAEEGIAESKKRLGALLYHPWPRVRTYVIDELWSLFNEEGEETPAGSELKSVDWGRANKDAIKSVVEKLGIATT